VIVAIMLYLWFTSFGSRHRYDLILNLRWSRGAAELPALERLLERHSFRAHCANQHFDSSDEGADLSYRLLLRDPGRVPDLLKELGKLPGVDQISSMKAEDESEV
jgi:hypothetical protein